MYHSGYSPGTNEVAVLRINAEASHQNSNVSAVSPALHVVFGAGQVGASLARALVQAGHRVRVVRRSDAPIEGGIEVRAGDARDAAFVRSAAEGASVLYHCMNPSAYTDDAWETEFPALGEVLIAAALTQGARLVVLDNLYGYGELEQVRTEHTPLAATGRKGRVRVAWDARLRAAAAEQGLRFVVGRAGDFFGPGAGANSLMSEAAIAAARTGKAVWLVGDADAVHAFSYVPAVVEGLTRMGTAPADVEGQVFHLPVEERAPRALVQALVAEGGGNARVYALPGWVVRALGLGVPLFRELRETLYQWERPFRASDAAYRARFGEPVTAPALTH